MPTMHKEQRPLKQRVLLRLEKCVFLAVLITCGWWLFNHGSTFVQWDIGELSSMKNVRIAGETKYIAREPIHEKLAQATDNGLFNIDLHALESAIAANDPWVAGVAIEIIWPFGVKAYLNEHRVIAHWGDDALLSTDGVIFTPPEIPPEINNLSLPTLYSDALGPIEVGPIEVDPAETRQYDDSERLASLLSLYEQAQAVLQATGRRIVSLRENAQFSVTLWLDDGVEVAIGRKGQIERVKRMVEVYAILFAEKKPEYIDLRYPTSVAVRYEGEQT